MQVLWQISVSLTQYEINKLIKLIINNSIKCILNCNNIFTVFLIINAALVSKQMSFINITNPKYVEFHI